MGAQGGGGGFGVEGGGQGAGCPLQVVGHRPQDQPGGVGVEVPRGQVGEGSGFAVGDDLFDDGVVAVLAFGLERLGGVVGEERVVAPDREQLALFAHDSGFGQVADAAHDQPGRDALGFLAAGEGGVGGYLGDLGA